MVLPKPPDAPLPPPGSNEWTTMSPEQLSCVIDGLRQMLSETVTQRSIDRANFLFAQLTIQGLKADLFKLATERDELRAAVDEALAAAPARSAKGNPDRN